MPLRVETKEFNHCIIDTARATPLSVKKDPLGHRLRCRPLGAGFANVCVPCKPGTGPFAKPGPYFDFFAFKYLVEVVNLMAAGDPDMGLVQRRRGDREPMPDGRVLDPADVDGVVHVAKLINVLRLGNACAENSGVEVGGP